MEVDMREYNREIKQIISVTLTVNLLFFKHFY